MRPHLLLMSAFVLLLASGAAAGTKLIARIAVAQPPQWDAPIVPQLQPNADAVQPLATAGTLTPGEPVWLNWMVHGNPAVEGYWRDALYVDGDLVQLLPRYNGAFVAHDFYALNVGPVFLRGGRHTITAHCDLDGWFTDGPADLYDNIANVQRIWTPVPIAMNATTGDWYPPPTAGDLALPNGEAYTLPRDPDRAWAVIVAPGTGDMDLRVYDDFVDSRNGLAHELGRSETPGDSLEMVVGFSDAAPAPLQALVYRENGAPPSGYVFEGRDATGRAGTLLSQWGAEGFDYTQMVQLYQLALQAGQPVVVALTRATGFNPMDLAVFAPVAAGGTQSLAQAIARGEKDPYQDIWRATFTAPVTGTYPVAVIRRHNTDPSAIQTRYRLDVQAGLPPLSVPAQPVFGLAEASPSPASTRTRLGFSLAQAGPARLEIFDALGRRVRTLLDGVVPAGAGNAVWDLRDARGRRVGGGVFWARLTSAEGTRQVRFVVIG